MSKVTHNHSLPTRVLHWVNAVIMAILIGSGLYISNPRIFSFFTTMDVARINHFIAMYLAIYGLVIRTYIGVRERDLKNFLPNRQDIRTLWPTVSYYLFLSKDMPEYKKYNPLQKIVYFVWVILFVIEAITGFFLYRSAFISGLFSKFGNPVFIRQVHILVAWTFIITFMIHIYMALLDGAKSIKGITIGTRKVKNSKPRQGLGPNPNKQI